MKERNIYMDISQRTKGDILIGVVGAVRTGKSTFIRRFMESIVLPNLEESSDKMRIIDELPQSAAGTMIMTTQPRFVPNEAAEVVLGEAKMNVRLIDCVGYMVKGARGYLDEDEPRMIKTPWYEEEIPFEEAADVGTKKVISEHSTIGIVVTTDGSITDIPRESYIEAEERTVKELKALKKPFIIVLNCIEPQSERCKKLRSELENKYGVAVVAVNALNMDKNDVENIFSKLLCEFPITKLNINLPAWVKALCSEHPLMEDMIQKTKEGIKGIEKINDADKIIAHLKTSGYAGKEISKRIYLGSGTVDIDVQLKEGLFYEVLSGECGIEISDDKALLITLKEMSEAKKRYDKVKCALEQVQTAGYGIVEPDIENFELLEPEMIKQGGRYGVKIAAEAPCVHMVRVDVKTEVSPIVGSQEQSEEMIKHISSEITEDENKIWDINILGKTLKEMVKEGFLNKVDAMPEEAKFKMREMLTKMTNEQNGGMLCILI